MKNLTKKQKQYLLDIASVASATSTIATIIYTGHENNAYDEFSLELRIKKLIKLLVLFSEEGKQK